LIVFVGKIWKKKKLWGSPVRRANFVLRRRQAGERAQQAEYPHERLLPASDQGNFLSQGTTPFCHLPG
jgi:hypothetical protein